MFAAAGRDARLTGAREDAASLARPAGMDENDLLNAFGIGLLMLAAAVAALLLPALLLPA